MDNVMKMKVFIDYALHKYYRSQADLWLAEHKKRQAVERNGKDEIGDDGLTIGCT